MRLNIDASGNRVDRSTISLPPLSTNTSTDAVVDLINQVLIDAKRVVGTGTQDVTVEDIVQLLRNLYIEDRAHREGTVGNLAKASAEVA